MQICQYEPKDRAAVREICYATGDAGRPEKVLTGARTYLGEMPLDWVA